MIPSLLKNFFTLVGAEVFGKLATFAAFAYLARLCGAAGFGYIEWAAAVLMCAGLIVDQGFSAYGAREIAKDSSKTATLTAEIVTARFALAAVAYLAVALFAFRFVNEWKITKLLLVYGLSLWALPLLLQWVFQGHDRMARVALIQLVRQLTFVAIVFALVRSADDLLLVGVAETISVVCAAVFSVWIYRSVFPSSVPVRPTLSVKLLREGTPIGFSQMFWVVKMFGATLIVGLIATAEETGYFAAAMRIFIALHTFVWLYHFNLLPSLSRAWQQGSERFSELIGQSMRIVTTVGLLAAVIWILTAPLAMTIVYGQSFARGGSALQWLAGACLAAAVSGHYRFGLIAANCQNKEMLTAALGAVTAIILVPLGYFQWGTSGAGAALCIGEIVVLFFAWFIMKRMLLNNSSDAAQNRTGAENYLENLPESAG